MKLLIVDDEEISLRRLKRLLEELYPAAEIVTAANYVQALVVFDESVSVAFLDVEMPEVDGLELAAMLQDRKPELNVVFVTAYDDYALQAHRLHASGYVTKPVSREALQEEMESLRHPLPQEKLYIRCFGSFEVFYHDRPVHFERRSAKEVLAYLVDLRGASANRMEISAALWEDADEVDKKRNYFRNLILSLRSTLKDCNAEEVLVCARDSYAIDPTKVDCDYYRYLEGSNEPGELFLGEYMTQYAWGENTLGLLEEQRYSKELE